MRPAKVCRVANAGGGRRGWAVSVLRCGGVLWLLWCCSGVSVRGLRAGDHSVVYVGRRCAGWEGSALGNPFRLGPGEAAGAASGRLVSGRGCGVGGWAAGLAGSALSGRGGGGVGRSCCGWAAGRAGGGRRCGWRAGAVSGRGDITKCVSWCGMPWCSWRVGGSGGRGCAHQGGLGQRLPFSAVT